MNFLLDTLEGGTFDNISTIISSLGAAFSDFTFVDFLDIAVLSAILFFVFRFFTTRKVWTIFVGICVCALILLVSVLIPLPGTKMLFSEVFSVGILAIILIFQPEIRAVLEKIGSGSIHGFMSLSERRRQNQVYLSTIDNVCSAVRELADSKTGALIVMTRTTKLDEIISSGTVINADVNSVLLRNLFFNKAPLHDGAVIIDETRIAAAACVLPLTRSETLNSDLGTRHRAAIGLSEMSDAVVIVVSEETGIISVAYDCHLEREFTAESLKTFLHKKILIGRSASRGAKVKSFTPDDPSSTKGSHS